jgi:hypothetical protein
MRGSFEVPIVKCIPFGAISFAGQQKAGSDSIGQCAAMLEPMVDKSGNNSNAGVAALVLVSPLLDDITVRLVLVAMTRTCRPKDEFCNDMISSVEYKDDQKIFI